MLCRYITGNALAWVQWVHKPVNLWDIKFAPTEFEALSTIDTHGFWKSPYVLHPQIQIPNACPDQICYKGNCLHRNLSLVILSWKSTYLFAPSSITRIIYVLIPCTKYRNKYEVCWLKSPSTFSTEAMWPHIFEERDNIIAALFSPSFFWFFFFFLTFFFTYFSKMACLHFKSWSAGAA